MRVIKFKFGTEIHRYKRYHVIAIEQVICWVVIHSAVSDEIF